jgi:3,4-dehydroadipyl-CoA semialdehyde dehydrogenase
VPESLFDAATEAIAARLQKTTVGNPRNDTVRMGSLVSRVQFDAVRAGLSELKAHTRTLYNGDNQALVDADREVACCMSPTLLGATDPDANALVHDTEVFGPVATLMPYRDLPHALQLVQRGQGSLVASLYGSDDTALGACALDLAASHGRVHAVSPGVATSQTGHGNVMPQSLHGGPGRAGGGEELGGLRALNFYHRRAAVQGALPVLSQIR